MGGVICGKFPRLANVVVAIALTLIQIVSEKMKQT